MSSVFDQMFALGSSRLASKPASKPRLSIVMFSHIYGIELITARIKPRPVGHAALGRCLLAASGFDIGPVQQEVCPSGAIVDDA